MLRTVADETPNPGTVTSSEDATGSPEAMYSRTSAARTRFDRSWDSWDMIGLTIRTLAVSPEDC